jgi:hypothetical protein
MKHAEMHVFSVYSAFLKKIITNEPAKEKARAVHPSREDGWTDGENAEKRSSAAQ